MGTSDPDVYEAVALEAKLAALAAHASQFAHVDGWRDRAERWNRQIGAERGYPAAEAFKRIMQSGT